MKPKAYEGTKPYIFISYAHKDSELVFRVMNSLQQEGYRIWYDDGIMPGSEWPENIAQHLDAAAMVISMVTPNSMDSHNCRREINFALSRRKPFLALVLAPTKMSLGMEMQLSAQHNIYLQNYPDWDDFIDKILKCEDMAPCREEAVKAAEDVPTAMPVEERPVVRKEAVAVKEAPAAAEPKKAERVAKPKKEKAPKVKREKPPKAKKPVGKILLGLLGCIAIAVALGLAIKSANTVTLSWGAEYNKSATTVYASNEIVTQDDLERIAAFSELKSVSFNDCDFTDCDFVGLEFASEQMYSVELVNCAGINDYGFLQNLAITELSLDGCENFTDLSVINQTELENLNISNTGISDLSGLTADLYYIYFDNTQVSDVSHLANLAKLWTVSGNNCPITSIDALAQLQNLEKLYFSGCPIKQVNVPFQSLKLYHLSFAGCGIDDMSGFANVTRLSRLDLSGNPQLTQLDWLNDQNCETLTRLYLGGSGLDAEDVAFIEHCTKLEQLNINGIPMSSLAVCKQLSELEELYAVGCGLQDISDLKNSVKLATLGLGFNKISDVDVLRIKNSYTAVDLSFNQLQNICALENMKIGTLLLFGNGPALAATVPEGLNGFNICVDWCEDMLTGGLKERGVYGAIYIVDCPADQVLRTQDVLGGGYCNFVEKGQLVQMVAGHEMTYNTPLDYSYAASLYQK